MKPEFYKKVLSNGMTVLVEKRNLPIISMCFAVKSGGINESLAEKGISHFIEHMVFKGTKNRTPLQITSEIEKKGGILNAFTSETVTAFHCKMPSENWEIGLDVLTDLVKNPLFDEEELNKERQVIFEEIKMIKDTPISHAFHKIQSCLYDGTLAQPLIGDINTMNSIDRQQLIDKFTNTFVPENMILCVVGDCNVEKVIEFVEGQFEGKKSFVEEQEIILKNKEEIEFRSGLDQSHIVFAYHVPTANEDESYAAYLLSALMAEGMSSRLFTEIREKRNLAYAIKGGCEIRKEFAYNYIYIGSTPQNIDKIREILLDEFEKVSLELSEQEFAESKQQVIGNYHLSFEDSEGQMINLVFSELNGNAEDYYRAEEKLNALKLNDVKELAKMAREKHSFFVLQPKD